MKRSVLFLFTVVLSIFFTYNIFAQDMPSNVDRENARPIMARQMRNMRPMMEKGFMGLMVISPDLADKIGLSEEQKGKLDDIITDHRKDMIKTNADISLAEIDLKKLLRQDNPDLNLVKEQIKKISDMKADKEFAQIKTAIDTKNILTKEQQEKLKELRKENRPQMRDQAKEKMKEQKETGKHQQRQKADVRPE